MLNLNEITSAVDMQEPSYRLLKWMAEAVRHNFISFDTAHEYCFSSEVQKMTITE